ncbi:hypothetical protein K435DRAFT_435324 [Dendrothele bispora CBS 962.96]|uniref:Uncharacterized protein n=1 Tax=Dendrothele bispora (strain CBS 962.96) TaxID=1314807 RepID=A0A4S8L3W8_DENBC|nr:hypothetical protein K435DRAFT_435324 [Dendrothele bispora CBS 962.96]
MCKPAARPVPRASSGVWTSSVSVRLIDGFHSMTASGAGPVSCILIDSQHVCHLRGLAWKETFRVCVCGILNLIRVLSDIYQSSQRV